jgi:hypothetical protein
MDQLQLDDEHHANTETTPQQHVSSWCRVHRGTAFDWATGRSCCTRKYTASGIQSKYHETACKLNSNDATCLRRSRPDPWQSVRTARSRCLADSDVCHCDSQLAVPQPRSASTVPVHAIRITIRWPGFAHCCVDMDGCRPMSPWRPVQSCGFKSLVTVYDMRLVVHSVTNVRRRANLKRASAFRLISLDPC